MHVLYAIIVSIKWHLQYFSSCIGRNWARTGLHPHEFVICVHSRGRILGRNPHKSLKSFPPCYFFKLTQPLTVSVKEKGGKPDRKPYPLPYGLRTPCRNLKYENSPDYATLDTGKDDSILFSYIPVSLLSTPPTITTTDRPYGDIVNQANRDIPCGVGCRKSAERPVKKSAIFLGSFSKIYLYEMMIVVCRIQRTLFCLSQSIIQG